MYLLDTNVISEIRKGERCDPNVAAWYGSISDTDIFLSVLVLGEVRKGIEKARTADIAKADALAQWLRKLELHHGDRILPIDRAVADEWGRISALRPVPAIDSLLAATAKTHGLTFVTRDADGVRDLGADILDPFKPPS